MRTPKDYAVLVLKGIGMGAADVVPGVSGGTIALIVGIYEELVNSIKSVNLHALKLLFTFKFSDFWRQINGSFLLSVVSGILISIYSLAKLVTFLLENHPVMIWAFFFGLVLSSIYYVVKNVSEWNVMNVFMFLVGTAVAYYITIVTPTSTTNDLWFIFLSGAIAICAMILPGISGSFILLLLGKYEYMMSAVKNLDIFLLVVFAAGALVGIVLFSRLLSYLLANFYNITISLLSGFMLGSLNKVWPWKLPVSYAPDGSVLTERNILPDAYMWEGIVLILVGVAVVVILETVSSRKEK
ncbi:MAG: DUF368 domain-containing protein [Bacteroidetes bacterium]|uniref:DUF368 domain-containing protein n=1 Tax=Candidatus Caccoplasma merdipullorum TaxID=2840718 RepID=A0A9D9E5W5_9BACT|nr:DUF368 domain-containing protein [Candidatus Caccoplasma merdipullorum]